MNKFLSRQDRFFMTAVEPSGCGKTELYFKMLRGNSFYPKFNHIIFLYRKSNKYTSKLSKVGVIFKKYAYLELLNNLENCLLIMYDSCGKNYNDKEFVKLATAGQFT